MSRHHELDAYLAGLLAKLEAPQRRALARAVAMELRRRQSERIAAQRNPDGTPYEPRKPQLRHKREGVRRKMFTRYGWRVTCASRRTPTPQLSLSRALRSASPRCTTSGCVIV